jgi:nitrogenase iron protein NifH
MMTLRQIAIYGKGGIGKSTISSNLAAALSEFGERVALVGCDPKRDSTSTLVGGKLLPTLLEHLSDHEKISREGIDSVIFHGFGEVMCIEVGGPKPGVGCTGRGILVGLQKIKELDIFGRYNVSFVIYDVLGDVICGGLASPIRANFAKEIYLVTSGELMALYAANNLLHGVKNIIEMERGGGELKVKGIIANMKGIPYEREMIHEFSRMVNVPVIHYIPRSRVVQDAEIQGKTVLEAFPHSLQAEEYRVLAEKIKNNQASPSPTPIELEEIQKLIREYKRASIVK